MFSQAPATLPFCAKLVAAGLDAGACAACPAPCAGTCPYELPIRAKMVRAHVPDISAPKYYLSGPEGMVKAMRKLLVEVGADEDNIKTEEFEGY